MKKTIFAAALLCSGQAGAYNLDLAGGTWVTRYSDPSAFNWTSDTSTSYWTDGFYQAEIFSDVKWDTHDLSDPWVAMHATRKAVGPGSIYTNSSGLTHETTAIAFSRVDGSAARLSAKAVNARADYGTFVCLNTTAIGSSILFSAQTNCPASTVITGSTDLQNYFGAFDMQISTIPLPGGVWTLGLALGLMGWAARARPKERSRVA